MKTSDKPKGVTDHFWQNQVHRLIKETKNYKQLHFIQKQDTREIIRENRSLKKKVMKQKKKLAEMDASMKEYKRMMSSRNHTQMEGFSSYGLNQSLPNSTISKSYNITVNNSNQTMSIDRKYKDEYLNSQFSKLQMYSNNSSLRYPVYEEASEEDRSHRYKGQNESTENMLQINLSLNEDTPREGKVP